MEALAVGLCASECLGRSQVSGGSVEVFMYVLGPQKRPSAAKPTVASVGWLLPGYRYDALLLEGCAVTDACYGREEVYHFLGCRAISDRPVPNPWKYCIGRYPLRLIECHSFLYDDIYLGLRWYRSFRWYLSSG